MEVAVLEPREVLRRGLAAMLERLNIVNGIEYYHSVSELHLARQTHSDECNPDIVIVSGALSGDTVDLVRNTYPASRVLIMVASAEPSDLAIAAKTQADGYLMLHDTTEPRLGHALQAVMRGELPIPQPIAAYLFERVRSTDVSPRWTRPYFNPGERNVIDLLLEGLSNRQIAQALGISLHSAKRRVSAVLHKANSPSRAHFVAQMLRDGTAALTDSEGPRAGGRVKGREVTTPAANASVDALPEADAIRRRGTSYR